MHGLPSMAGNFSFTLLDALSPTAGAVTTGLGGGGGVCQEANAFPHCTVANGLENSKPVSPPEPSPAFALLFPPV